MKKDGKRQGEQLSAKKGKYVSTLDGLILGPQQLLLPVLTTQERKDLDINTTGPYALWEFWKSDPYHIGYSGTTRYTAKVATERVLSNKQLESLTLEFEAFNETKKSLKLPLRKYHLDSLEGLRNSFRWFSHRTNVHAWHFNERDKLIVEDTLTKAQLPPSIFFAFMIEVILESSKLSDVMREDLLDELHIGRCLIERIENEIKSAIKVCAERASGNCGNNG